MRNLRVVFLDQVGGAAGGAEETLAIFLRRVPRDLAASVVLFEDGAFAERLRGYGLPVEIVPIPESVGGSTRERMQVRGALELVPTAARVAAILRARRADLLYTNSMKAHFIGGVAARLADVRCVMHFHDMVDGAALLALRTAARLGSRERIACSRAVADHVDLPGTTAIYAPLELDAYATLPDRVAARAELGLPQDVPVVSLVGRINRWKGHDAFLRIAKRVRTAVPAHFAIVGAPVFRDADFLPELQSFVDELRLRAHVTFLPWLDDVRKIYAATDVNVNCSRREPFGRAIVEAAACGVPTVCYDDSGAAETVIDGVSGRKVTAGDEIAFADAILEYLTDSRRLAAAQVAALDAATRFAAPRIAEEMAEVVRRAAQRGA